MPRAQTAKNPFYIVLLAAGILFLITACAYFMMAIRESQGIASAEHRLTELVSLYGMTAMMGELVLLAIATAGAMATDDYWIRRSAHSRNPDPSHSGPAADRPVEGEFPGGNESGHH